SHRLRGLDQAEHLYQVCHADLPERQFPPLRTLDPQRANLPEPLDSFIGREAEVAAVSGLLLGGERAQGGSAAQGPARLVTLTGMGGIGKTRVALEVAERCAGHVPDGVWWVALESTREA